MEIQPQKWKTSISPGHTTEQEKTAALRLISYHIPKYAGPNYLTSVHQSIVSDLGLLTVPVCVRVSVFMQ